MEPGSKQDGEVVNMTRAIEALSPLLKHPRRTIVKVEAVVIATAGLLLFQLVLGFCKRRWHKSWVKHLLQVPSKLMNPLIIYTLGTMQSSPIKNSSYPVWAAFLIMASAGTTTVRQYDFGERFSNKYLEFVGEATQYLFYVVMFLLLMDPNTYNSKTALDLKRHLKNPRPSSLCVTYLVIVVFFTKLFESGVLVLLGYRHNNWSLFFPKLKIICRTHIFFPKFKIICRTQVAGHDRTCDSDSDPQNMKGYKYAVCSRLCAGGLITIDQIWDSCGNSAEGKALKDMCLSCALFWRLVHKRYFGRVYPKTNLLKDHDFVFKKLLPSERDFKRAFRIIEEELGFCYNFFFTKIPYTFLWMNNMPVPPAVPFIQPLVLLKIIFISIVIVLVIKESLVLETPNPIILVHISKFDYIITLLVLCIALIVELVQAVFYLGSNWAQVSLACLHVRKNWFEPSAFIYGKVIGFVRRVTISGKLRNKIGQHSVIVVFPWKQPNPVEVSDEVKRAVARSLISTYGSSLTTNGETLLWQNQIFDEYYWTFKDLSHVEVMLIWHIATEYCDISGPTPSNWTTPCRCSKHRGFADHLSRCYTDLFGYVLEVLCPSPRRNSIARDSHRGVAVHLSRYCAYLIGYVPELLPYHDVADIAELTEKVMNERTEFFGIFFRLSKISDKMKNLEGTEEEDDPRKIFQKGVKLGKQLKRLADGHHWKVLEDFWAETIIHAAKSHYKTEQHMQHLGNGGEFLTHIWAILAHAGILNLDRGKDQKGQGNLDSGPSADHA